MTGVKFTSQVSVGNIMQSALLLIAMGAAFATLREVAINNKAAIQSEQRRSIDQDAQHDLRLRTLESAQRAGFAQAEERYRATIDLLQRIDKRLERMEGGK